MLSSGGNQTRLEDTVRAVLEYLEVDAATASLEELAVKLEDLRVAVGPESKSVE